MKHFFRTLRSFLLLGLFLIGVSAYSQDVIFKDGIQQGVVKVKFSPTMTSTLSQVQISTKGNKLTTGIASLDRATRAFKATKMTRIFPDNPQNADKLRKHGLHLWYTIEIDEKIDPKTVLKTLSSLQEVQIAECALEKVIAPYKVVKQDPTTISPYAAMPFNDPFLKDQWHYNNTDQLKLGTSAEQRADINLFEAWKKTAGRSDIIVSIHDEGVDVKHEDLKDNIWVNKKEIPGNGIDDDGNGYVDDINGFNFTNNSGQIPNERHGTHVAGTVSAVNNNGIGVSGVAGGTGKGDGVKIMSLKIIAGASSVSIARSYVYASDNGAVISQNSWGYTTPNVFEQEVLDAIDYFIAEAGNYPGSPMKGGVVIFASGNSTSGLPHYPAAHKGVLSVSAVGPTMKIATYSNYGEYISVTAPGGDAVEHGLGKAGVFSTLPNNEYGYLDGTSMACPHVSGIAALAIANSPKQITSKQLFNKLFSGTRDVVYKYNPTFLGKLGTGIIDANLAIQNDGGKAPDIVTDFSLVGISQDFATLRWLVPADEDDGTPFSFNLYYSKDTITSKNLAGATKIEISNSKAVGDTIDVEINDLLSNTKYYFAVEAVDRWEHKSDLSEVLVAMTNNGPQIGIDAGVGATAINVSTNDGTSGQFDFKILNKASGLLRWTYFTRNSGYIHSATAYSQPISRVKNITPNTILVDSKEVNYPVVRSPRAVYPKRQKKYANFTTKWIGDTDNSVSTSSATKFVVDDADGFNLTDLEFALRYTVDTDPIIIEVYKSTLDKTNLLYTQTVTSKVAITQSAALKLNQQLFFEKGEQFYVVIHVAPGSQYPLGVGGETSEEYSKYCYYSVNRGEKWMPLEEALSSYPEYSLLAWNITAISKHEDVHKYITLAPEKGEVAGNSNMPVKLVADGSKLINGEYRAVTILESNDNARAKYNIPVVFTVAGHKPEIVTPEIVDFGSVFEGSESIIEVELANIGYGLVKNLTYSVKGSDFTITGLSPREIKARDLTKIRVKFKPTKTGNINGSLILTNGTYTNEIKLFGVGSGTAKVIVTPASQFVDNLNIGTPVDVKLTVKNVGEYPLKYFVPGFDKKGISNNWPTPYHSYGYVVRSNVTEIGHGTPLTYSFTDISTTGVDITKDFMVNPYKEVKFGFDFPYYDSIEDHVYITNCGLLTFDNSVTRFNTPSLNNTSGPAGIISAAGLVAGTIINGKVHYKKETDRLIVQYTNIDYLGSSMQYYTLQIVLFSNGNIRYVYKDISGADVNYFLTVLLESKEKKDGISVRDIDYNTSLKVPDSTIIGFDYPGPNIIKEIENGSAILTPGDSAIVKVKLTTDKLNEGLVNRNINIVTNDPKNINVIGEVKLNVISGGVVKTTLTNDTVDFGTIYKDFHYSLPFYIKNNGTKVANIIMISPNPNITVSGVPMIKPGLNEVYNITPKTIFATTINDVVYIKYEDNTRDTIHVKAKVIDPPRIEADTTLLYKELNVGEKYEHPFIIKNTGNSDLEVAVIDGTWFNFQEINGTGTQNKSDYISRKYNNGEPAYSWVDILGTGTKEVYDYDNNQFKERFWHKVGMPWKFTFDGEEYDSIAVGDNGIIALGRGLPELLSSTEAFPTDDDYAYLMPAWTAGDLDIYQNADIAGLYHQVFDDKVVITWEYIMNLMQSTPLSAQTILYKDGTIKFAYKTRKGFETTSVRSVVGWKAKKKETTILSYLTDLDHGKGLAYLILPVNKKVIVPGQEMKGNIKLDASKVNGGLFLDSIQIESNDPKSPLISKKIQTRVVGDTIVTIESKVDFGVKEVVEEYGQPKEYTQSFKIKNEGDVQIVVTNIRGKKNDDIFKMNLYYLGMWGHEWTPVNVVFWNPVEFVILPGDDLEVLLSFAPAAAGNFVDTMVITTNEGVYEVAFTGQAFNSPVIGIKREPIDVLFNSPEQTEKHTIKFDNKNSDEVALNYDVSINYRRFSGDVASQSVETLENATTTFTSTTSTISKEAIPNFVTETSDDEFNRRLTYVDSLPNLGFTGTGGTEPLSIFTKYNVGPKGFNLSAIGGWFRLEDTDVATLIVEVKAGGSSVLDAVSLFRGSLEIENKYTYDSLGQLYDIDLGTEVSIYPDEDLYVLFTLPAGLTSPIGAVVGEEFIEYVPGRFGIKYSGAWLDAQQMIIGFENAGFITYAGERVEKEHGWLRILNNQKGSIAKGDSTSLDVEFSGKYAVKGTQNAYIVFKTNDSNRPKIEIPASLHMNEAPHFTLPHNITAIENKLTEVNIPVVDKEGDAFTVEMEKGKSYVEYKLEQNILKLNLTPKIGDAGLDTIIFKATDEHGASRLVDVIITIQGALDYTGDSTIYLNVDGEDLVYSIYDLFRHNAGDKLSFTTSLSADGIVSILKSEEQLGIHPLKIGEVELQLVVTSSNGMIMQHTIKVVVNGCIPTTNFIIQKWDNVLIANVNSSFVSNNYQWYQDGMPIPGAIKQFYAAGGDGSEKLDTNSEYKVKLVTVEGVSVYTCPYMPKSSEISLRAYPNPVKKGQVVTLEAKLLERDKSPLVVKVFDISGQLVKSLTTTEENTFIAMPNNPGYYLIKVENESVEKTFKVVVE